MFDTFCAFGRIKLFFFFFFDATFFTDPVLEFLATL